MENIKEINLAELVSAVVRKIWLIVLCAVIAGGLAYTYTSNFITPLYRSRVTIYVNNTVMVNSSNNVAISASDLATSQRLVLTYVNILKSDRVLDKVAESIGGGLSAGYIRSLMTAGSLEETEVFEVYISHSDPKLAARIANAIAEVAPAEIANIVEGSSTKIIDKAKVAGAPYTPNKTRNTTYGIAVGAVLALCAILLQTLLDVRVKGEEDLAMLSSAPVLGLIPDLAVEIKGEYGYKGYTADAKHKKEGGTDK